MERQDIVLGPVINGLPSILCPGCLFKQLFGGKVAKNIPILSNDMAWHMSAQEKAEACVTMFSWNIEQYSRGPGPQCPCRT